MKKNSLKKNYIYNVMYQIVAIITPLITTPYISRVLGNEGVGQSAYVASITAFFLLIANLGFALYAQREIAKYQDNPQKRTIIFWEIMICKSIISTIAVTSNIILSLLKVYGDYSFLMMIMTIHLFSTYFDIAFFFEGMEKFGTIAIKNISVRLIGTILIFVFVKTNKDVWIYILLQCLIILLSDTSLWISLFKNIVTINIRELKPFKHFIPSLRLFVPTIALTVYTIFDKALIGWLIPGTIEKISSNGEMIVTKLADYENGMYSHSENVVKMLLTIITALGATILPRNGFLFKNGRIEEAKENINKSFKFTFFLGMPLMFGIAAVSRNFSPWFFGDAYGKIPFLIMMMAPLIIIIGFNNILGNQYLIAIGKDTQYTISIVVGAIVNIIFDIILIPILFSYGATIGTIVAELSVFIVQLIFLKKDFSFSFVLKKNWKYILFSLIMFACIYPFSSIILSPSIVNTLFSSFLGATIYFSLLLISNDNFLISILHELKEKIVYRIS